MFTRAIAAMKTAHARREAINSYERLLSSDDALLRDIGLTRTDLRNALRRR